MILIRISYAQSHPLNNHANIVGAMRAKQFCVLTTAESREKIWYQKTQLRLTVSKDAARSKAVIMLLLNHCLLLLPLSVAVLPMCVAVLWSYLVLQSS